MKKKEKQLFRLIRKKIHFNFIKEKIIKLGILEYLFIFFAYFGITFLFDISINEDLQYFNLFWFSTTTFSILLVLVFNKLICNKSILIEKLLLNKKIKKSNEVDSLKILFNELTPTEIKENIIKIYRYSIDIDSRIDDSFILFLREKKYLNENIIRNLIKENYKFFRRLKTILNTKENNLFFKFIFKELSLDLTEENKEDITNVIIESLRDYVKEKDRLYDLDIIEILNQVHYSDKYVMQLKEENNMIINTNLNDKVLCF